MVIEIEKTLSLLFLFLSPFFPPVYYAQAAVPGSHPELIVSTASVHNALAPFEEAGPPVPFTGASLFFL